MLAEIKKGNNKTKWENRVPYAYWKGNPYVAPTRQDLLKCNVSDQHDWNTRLYIQVTLLLFFVLFFFSRNEDITAILFDMDNDASST